MSKPEQFTVRYEPSSRSDLGGHWWTVRDESRAVRAQGFSSGAIRWAKQDARDAIAELHRAAATTTTHVTNTETRSAS